MEFLKNPTTVKMLAAQIIKACDNYIALQLPEKQLKELVITSYSIHYTKLYEAGSSNKDNYRNQVDWIKASASRKWIIFEYVH